MVMPVIAKPSGSGAAYGDKATIIFLPSLGRDSLAVRRAVRKRASREIGDNEGAARERDGYK